MIRIAIVLALCSYSAHAAGAHGYLFPTPGEVTMTTAIGVPYLAVSEISVGITHRFSTGVLLAVADEIGVGIRPRLALFTAGPAQIQKDDAKVADPPESTRK